MFQISKVAIKNYQIGRRIPHCGIELELLSEQVQRLRHKVDIKGISPHGENFFLRYPQSDGERLNNNDQNKAPRVQMPRWNATISHTTAAAIIIPCTM